MSLKNWLKNGWLKEHKTSREEIADLFAVADRDLEASAIRGLHEDWKFNIAYNAALQLATAALAASGYPAERGAHHYRVIQTLQFTIGMDTNGIRKFDTFRKKRNVADYERVLNRFWGKRVIIARRYAKVRRDRPGGLSHKR